MSAQITRRLLVVALVAVAVSGYVAAVSASAGGDAEGAEYVWRNVEIVGGGYVPGIIFNTSEPDLVYARTDIGGAYRWNTHTSRWIPLLDWVGWDNWGYSGVDSLATDPVDPDRVYVLAGTYTNSWDPNNGAVLRSRDRGRSWKISVLPFKSGGNMPGRNMGERLVIDPNKNSILYLGARSGNGLWRSTDFGRTWSRVNSFPAGVGTYSENPERPERLRERSARRHLGRVRPTHRQPRQSDPDHLRRRRRPRPEHLPQHGRWRDLGGSSRPTHHAGLHAPSRRAGLDRHPLRHLQQQGRTVRRGQGRRLEVRHGDRRLDEDHAGPVEQHQLLVRLRRPRRRRAAPRHGRGRRAEPLVARRQHLAQHGRRGDLEADLGVGLLAEPRLPLHAGHHGGALAGLGRHARLCPK